MKPSINDLLVYTPAKDFELSKRFYSALGFEMTKGWGDTVDCRLGGATFRLQNYYVKDWAENFMMRFGVDDVPAWYGHAKAVIASGNYDSASVSEPEMAGETLVCHVGDPSGRSPYIRSAMIAAMIAAESGPKHTWTRFNDFLLDSGLHSRLYHSN